MVYIVLFSIVIMGGLLAFIVQEDSKQFVKLLLSFSGAYLLSIIVFHLLPDIYQTDDKKVGVFIMLGIIFQLILELFSHGAEHGHQHKFDHKAPWLLFLSLSIHAFMEGLPINEGHHLHTSYFYGILIHKLPIAIVLTTLMIKANYTKQRIFVLLIIFASMSPLAAYVGTTFDFMLTYGAYINAFVVGILAHIGTNILFENEHSHSFNARKFALIFTAIFIAYLS